MDATACGLTRADDDARPENLGTDMMNRTGVVIGAALLAACGASGQGDGQAQAAAATTRPIDVGGIRLGMTLPETEAAMKAGGWTVEREAGRNWDQTVDNQISIRRTQMGDMPSSRKGVKGLRGRKGDEDLSAAFAQTPQGERVQTVSYAAPRAGRTSAQYLADLTRRYGTSLVNPSTSGRSNNLYYAPNGRDGVHLSSDMDSSRVLLYLDRGVAADRAWSASVDRAATAKAGPVGKSF